MKEDLDQLLRNLQLHKIREILDQELNRAEKSGPSYADFLTGLLRQEYHQQQDRFLEYRIKRARLPERWSLESFPWRKQPGVKKAMIEQLAELGFLSEAANLVFMGPTGVGKTGLASAILLKALQAGHRGVFIKVRAPDHRDHPDRGIVITKIGPS